MPSKNQKTGHGCRVKPPASFAAVPETLIRDPNISDHAKTLWAELYLCGREYRDANPEYLSERFNTYPRTIRRWLMELEEHGWLIWHRKNRGPYRYELISQRPQDDIPDHPDHIRRLHSVLTEMALDAEAIETIICQVFSGNGTVRSQNEPEWDDEVPCQDDESMEEWDPTVPLRDPTVPFETENGTSRSHKGTSRSQNDDSIIIDLKNKSQNQDQIPPPPGAHDDSESSDPDDSSGGGGGGDKISISEEPTPDNPTENAALSGPARPVAARARDREPGATRSGRTAHSASEDTIPPTDRQSPKPSKSSAAATPDTAALHEFLMGDLRLTSTKKVQAICARLADVPLERVKAVCRERWQSGARNGALANFLETAPLSIFADAPDAAFASTDSPDGLLDSGIILDAYQDGRIEFAAYSEWMQRLTSAKRSGNEQRIQRVLQQFVDGLNQKGTEQ